MPADMLRMHRRCVRVSALPNVMLPRAMAACAEGSAPGPATHTCTRAAIYTRACG